MGLLLHLILEIVPGKCKSFVSFSAAHSSILGEISHYLRVMSIYGLS